MENKQPALGAICHVEIAASDPAAAKEFYGACFGWEFTEVPEMSYTLFTTGEGGIGGGIMARQEGMPAQHVNYLNVADVAAGAQTVESHGGKMLVGKTEVPGAGWFTICADPDGNVFGLWQSAKGQ